ncbi:hypothetical protein niasHT_002131 [Heterodera trifolii]|uniref:HMG box domain-containing protein n=1 Tax=Heterodera trifolii TaxID=157864 RepID=A0ABD2MD60_9BILA
MINKIAKVTLFQKFGRLSLGGNVCFRVRTDVSKLSTTFPRLAVPTSVSGVELRLPSKFNAPRAFAIFLREQFGAQTGLAKDIVKTVSVTWNNLSDDEKQRYADSAKKVADEKRENFQALSEEQKQALIEQHESNVARRRRFRKKKSLHKLYADTNRPKRPLVSYMLFANQQQQSVSLSSREERVKFVKDLGEQWRRMTDTEKEPYVTESRHNLAIYNHQVEEWKEKYADEIGEWRKANVPKTKKKMALKGKRKMKAAKKVGLKKKEKETKLASGQKKGRIAKGGGTLTTGAKKGDEEEAATELLHSLSLSEPATLVTKGQPKKKAVTGKAAKKVKKADVKGAVD